ncbi:dihydroxy-acid dehydratase, partial [Mesorhizobium sp. M4B.F.Ca.ET.203.01.1.1]
LDNDDWQKVGLKVPLIVNLQPSGEYLGEDYHHAGGVPAVVAELMKAGMLPHPDALTVNGKSIGDNCKGVANENTDVIRTVAEPLKANAGFINFKGNLFDSAIMKMSGISPEFRERYLSNPN